MNIVVVYQFYQADKAPGHSLIYNWTQHLATCGHEVIVMAGETGYMQCDKPSLPWYRRIIRIEQQGKVKVYRTLTYSQLHRTYLGRVLSFITFSISCFITLLFLKKPDLTIASSPPIFSVFSTWFVCKLRKISFVIEVRDLWPESAIQMGVLKNKLLIKLMSFMEKTIYDQAHTVLALTEGIFNNLSARGWSNSKVILSQCGVDITQIYPDDAAGLAIRKYYHLEDKKIILYFGALGEANNIPVILRAAKCLEQNKDIIFMLVGDGMQRKAIEDTIKNLELNNVLLLKAVPKHAARSYLNAADLCLVTLLDIPLFAGALPTKLFEYLACNKTVLCGVKGEAKRLLEKAQTGFTFDPNDDKQLADLIIKTVQDMDNNALTTVNSFEFIKNNYNALQTHKIFEKLVLNTKKS